MATFKSFESITPWLAVSNRLHEDNGHFCQLKEITLTRKGLTWMLLLCQTSAPRWGQVLLEQFSVLRPLTCLKRVWIDYGGFLGRSPWHVWKEFELIRVVVTPLHAGRQCWGKTILPRAGYRLGTYRTVDIFNFSLISWAILEKLGFLCFYIIK